MKLYMGVTLDEYELPLCVAETVVELARMYRTTPSAIYTNIYNKQSGRNNGVKFIKLEWEDTEDDNIKREPKRMDKN